MVNDQFQLCFLYFAILIVLHFHVANSKITHHLFENIQPKQASPFSQVLFYQPLRDMVEHVGGVLEFPFIVLKKNSLFPKHYNPVKDSQSTGKT